MIDSTRLLVEVYNTISGSIQYYQWKYTILSVWHLADVLKFTRCDSALLLKQ